MFALQVSVVLFSDQIQILLYMPISYHSSVSKSIILVSYLFLSLDYVIPGTGIFSILFVTVYPMSRIVLAEWINEREKEGRKRESRMEFGFDLRITLQTFVVQTSGTGTGLPWWLSSKDFTCQCRRHGSNPWVRKIPWRRKWLPTLVFFPGKSHVQRRLVGYSPWGWEELDAT